MTNPSKEGGTCHTGKDTDIREGIVPGLSNEAYHADTEWLSSTALKHYLPERYSAGGSQDALDFGTLFHSVTLEPDSLADSYAVLDAEKIGVKADGTPAQNPTMTKAWKDAVAEAEAGGRTVVAQSDWDRAHAMAEAVFAHGEAADLLNQAGAAPEVSLFAEDENGVKHKARFDLLAPVGVDLKSTSAKPGTDSLARTVIDYGYDLSAHHYREVARLAGYELDDFAFVFCSKTLPYRVTVAYLDADFMARGAALRTLAIARATDPTQPAYDGATGRVTLRAPGWARINTPTPAGIPADFTWSIDDYS